LINNNLLFFCADNAAANNTAFPPGDISPVTPEIGCFPYCAPLLLFARGNFLEIGKFLAKLLKKYDLLKTLKTTLKKIITGG
jgi:hypothetical protein